MNKRPIILSRFFFVFLFLGWGIEASANTNGSNPAPETFATFAAAWLDYQDGDYAEAMRRFHDAALLDHRFSPATTGIKACAYALGFPQISDAVDRYSTELASINPNLVRFADGIEPGLAFWGVFLDGEIDRVDLNQVDELQAALDVQLKNLMGPSYIFIHPLSQPTSEDTIIPACEYNIMGMVVKEADQLFLDLYFIQHWDVATTEAKGLSTPESGVKFTKQRTDVTLHEFADFIASDQGAEFLTDFINGGDNEIPDAFTPKFDYSNSAASEDFFSNLSRIVQSESSYPIFADTINSDSTRHGPLLRFLNCGLLQWYLETMPEGSDERSLVAYVLRLQRLDRFSGHKKTTWEEENQWVIQTNPNTIGATMASLNLITRELNRENFFDYYATLLSSFQKIQQHPLLLEGVSVRYYEGPPARSYPNSVRVDYTKILRDFKELSMGEFMPNGSYELYPLYSRINLTSYKGEVKVNLTADSLKGNLNTGSNSSKSNNANHLLDFHAKIFHNALDRSEVLKALNDDPESLYLLYVACEALNQNSDTQTAATESLDWELSEAALLSFEQVIRHPERQQIRFQFLLQFKSQINQAAKANGYYQSKRGSTVRKFINNAIYDACNDQRWGFNQSPKALELKRAIDAIEPEEDAEILRANRLFLNLVDLWIEQPEIREHWSIFYLDWLLREGHQATLLTFLEDYESRIVDRLPFEQQTASYEEVFCASNFAVSYLKMEMDERALVFLKPFLDWELEPYSRIGYNTATARIAQACAWLASLLIERGDYETAEAALERAISLSEGESRDYTRFTASRLLNQWEDAEYPNLQEYILSLKKQLK